MRNRLTVCVIFLLMVSFCFVCCSNINPGSKIVGKWKFIKTTQDGKLHASSTEYHKNMIIEFYSDNTFKFENSSGKWVILDDGRIKMTRDVGFIYLGNIKDNELIIIPGGNEKWYFQRL